LTFSGMCVMKEKWMTLSGNEDGLYQVHAYALYIKSALRTYVVSI
jgi:hypothetical protein